jgi:hypothetical protein
LQARVGPNDEKTLKSPSNWVLKRVIGTVKSIGAEVEQLRTHLSYAIEFEQLFGHEFHATVV